MAHLPAASCAGTIGSIYPDVYIPKSMCKSLEAMTVGAWLWSERQAVITGRAAAALHGSKWVDDNAPVELLWRNNHHPAGLIVRNERFQQEDEVTSVDGLTVATPARAGFDLARHLPRTAAVAHLDALARATRIMKQDLMCLVAALSRCPREQTRTSGDRPHGRRRRITEGILVEAPLDRRWPSATDHTDSGHRRPVRGLPRYGLGWTDGRPRV